MRKLILALFMSLTLSGIALAAVNINTATKEELTSIKGVGDKRAQDIIDYRTKNGPFKSVDDLEKVPGVGPGLMKQIRPQLTTTGKTVVEKSPTKAAKGKSADAPKAAAESAKGDAMKAERAKEKVADKTKSDEKKIK
jgi:competence protein ComEA